MNSKPSLLRPSNNYIPADQTDITKTWAKHGWVAPSKAKEVVAEHEWLHRILTLRQYIDHLEGKK